MKTFALHLLICAATFGLMINVAQAVPIVFSGVDPGANSFNPRPNSDAAAAAFDGACARGPCKLSVENFEASPVGPFSFLRTASGVSLLGTQSIRNTPLASPDGLSGYNTTAGGRNFLSIFGGDITFAFDSPICAFGAYISGVQFFGETITFFDGTSQTIPIPNSFFGVQFLGFTDFMGGISSITIHANSDIIGIDDVRFCECKSGEVAEPVSLALIGLGLVALGTARRSRRLA